MSARLQPAGIFGMSAQNEIFFRIALRPVGVCSLLSCLYFLRISPPASLNVGQAVDVNTDLQGLLLLKHLDRSAMYNSGASGGKVVSVRHAVHH